MDWIGIKGGWLGFMGKMGRNLVEGKGGIPLMRQGKEGERKKERLDSNITDTWRM